MTNKIPTAQLDKQLEKALVEAASLRGNSRAMLNQLIDKGVAEVIKGGCQIHPKLMTSLTNRIKKLEDKEKRRQADQLLKQLTEMIPALWDERVAVDGMYDDIRRVVETVSGAVHDGLFTTLSKLETWVEGMRGTSRTLHYNTNELLRLTASSAPAKVSKPKSTGANRRPSTMAKESITSLLKQLGASGDQDEKRLLRKKLRALGHTGGLGGKKKKVVKKKVAKKKVAKKKVVKKTARSAAE